MEQQRTDGLALAEKYYTEYGSRARELKAAGRQVIGYLSALGPVYSHRRNGRTGALSVRAPCPIRQAGDY